MFSEIDKVGSVLKSLWIVFRCLWTSFLNLNFLEQKLQCQNGNKWEVAWWRETSTFLSAQPFPFFFTVSSSFEQIAHWRVREYRWLQQDNKVGNFCFRFLEEEDSLISDSFWEVMFLLLLLGYSSFLFPNVTKKYWLYYWKELLKHNFYLRLNRIDHLFWMDLTYIYLSFHLFQGNIEQPSYPT